MDCLCEGITHVENFDVGLDIIDSLPELSPSAETLCWLDRRETFVW